MPESFCRVGGGLSICFETFGEPADPAMLLIMGLGTQMLGWHEDFCNELAGRGFFVIRYDNRDIGRSTILRRHPSRPSARSCAATSAPPPTRSPRWPPTASACSTTSRSTARISSASRWAA